MRAPPSTAQAAAHRKAQPAQGLDPAIPVNVSVPIDIAAQAAACLSERASAARSTYAGEAAALFPGASIHRRSV
ncbi:hypothetical protein [Xanthomonas sp. WHRI 7945]|nr:hypothetical protein [Xanthomonas campestris pv. campestris]